MNNIHILHLIADCIIDPLRINHSCSPNVVWSWAAASGGYEVKEVRAVRLVEAGEELCANYIDSFQVGASACTLLQYNIAFPGNFGPLAGQETASPEVEF